MEVFSSERHREGVGSEMRRSIRGSRGEFLIFLLRRLKRERRILLIRGVSKKPFYR